MIFFPLNPKGYLEIKAANSLCEVNKIAITVTRETKNGTQVITFKNPELAVEGQDQLTVKLFDKSCQPQSEKNYRILSKLENPYDEVLHAAHAPAPFCGLLATKHATPPFRIKAAAKPLSQTQSGGLQHHFFPSSTYMTVLAPYMPTPSSADVPVPENHFTILDFDKVRYYPVGGSVVDVPISELASNPSKTVFTTKTVKL